MKRKETEYYKPCSICHNDECAWTGTKDTHLVCEDYKSIAQEPKTEWIPVSERLPKEYGSYLVTKAYYNKTTNKVDYEIAVERVTLCCQWQRKNHRIVAWMPLPEPYKEG